MNNQGHYGCRLTKNMTLCGYEALVLENRYLRMTVLPGKGADIYELIYKPLDVDFLWHYKPLEEIGKKQYPMADNTSFIHYYEGGWQEIFPNGGGFCQYKNATLPTHGEVCTQPWQWQVLQEDENAIKLQLSVTTLRTPFKMTRTYTLLKDSPWVAAEGCIENLSPQTLSCMWGIHPALGAPFINEHCIIKTNAGTVITGNTATPTHRAAPGQNAKFPLVMGQDGKTVDLSKMPPPQMGVQDMLYLKDFDGDPYFTVFNPLLKVGFSMKFDKKTFPYLWYWMVSGGFMDYPYFGRTYVLALEPFSSYPGGLVNAIENGTAITLAGYEKKSTAYTFGAVTGEEF